MKMKLYLASVIVILAFATQAQQLTQTVRGTVFDNDSKLPLIGVSVVLNNSIILGTTTDSEGRFRFDAVPVGRINIQLSYVGYQPQSLSNIEVRSAKEVVLDIHMQELVVKLDEVVIKSNRNKGNALNDMSLISSRSISTDETQRFTGAFNDPSRVVASFAGVQNSPDGNSDIIVRGNSPKYVQWRLEGVEISSPYHFDDQNAAAGGLSAINNNLLATSDFYTGAFSAEYGDVLSSVYDVKFRAGNNEKHEQSLGVGIVGTDLTLEGPFKKDYAGSYLFNYRYNTISIIQDLGLVSVPGNTNFQDAAFNVKLPTKKAGMFSVFGFGGIDGFFMEDVTPKMWATSTNKTVDTNMCEDFEKHAYLGNVGINHIYSLNGNSFIHTTVAYTGSGINDNIHQRTLQKIYNNDDVYLHDSTINSRLSFKSRLNRSTYRFATTYSNKLNAKNKIEIGIKYTLFNYNYEQSMVVNASNDLFKVIDFNVFAGTLRNFVTWRYKINNSITIVSGLHNMNALINHKSTIEPRLAFDCKLNSTNSLNAGYGLHSNMESIPNYFARVQQPDGSVIEPNKNLDLLKAHHFVVGYEKRFSENLRAKVDVYYQYLFNIPVENNDTSYYSTINEGIDYKYVALVNKGTGENYGMEITLERFFTNNYYFLITASLYNSTYKTLENIERSTRYNNKYMVNVLAGKEWVKLGKSQNKSFGVNTRLFFRGGQPYIPLLRDNSGNLAVDPENNRYWDYANAYKKRMENIYQVNLSVSYKINKPKTTHEFYLDLQNLTNNQGKLYEYYDANEPGSVGYNQQIFFFPNLMYKLYF